MLYSVFIYVLCLSFMHVNMAFSIGIEVRGEGVVAANAWWMETKVRYG